MAVTRIHKSVGGFSLLELSIVVVVIGYTIGMGITTFNQYSRLSKAELTRERMKVILKALDDYADKYTRLPCPADGSLAFSHDNFGLGLKTGGTDNCSVYNINSAGVYVGMVPVNTLNIYPSFALDGWGNRFTYAVTSGSVASGGVNPAAAGMLLVNYSGTSLFASVPVTVISHGENGYGAWRGNGGSRLSTSPNSPELYNSTFSTNTLYISQSRGNFDDIVYFMNVFQILNDDFE